MIEQRLGVFEHTIGEPVLAHELPDVVLWVELGALWQQRVG